MIASRYLGDTRIVTKLNSGENPTYQEESRKQYYYHSDHLGSAAMISDHQGDEYQRLEYTPYGETWVEKTQNTGLEFLPYKFTGKELDEETGLYYYGARYLDPKYSLWISTDPALGEYIPQAPINDEAKKNNQNLPGMGGLFNHVNHNLYHYGGNNPIRYIDPTGMWVDNEDGTYTAEEGDTLHGLYGDDWQEKSGFTRDPTTLQVGETVGKKKESSGNSSQNKISKPGEYCILDLAVDKNDIASALFLKSGADVRPEQGQFNINTQVGVATVEKSTSVLSLFDGNLKMGFTGSAGGFTADAWAGVKDNSAGFGVDASMLNFSGSVDITICGITGSVGGGVFVGGVSKGFSVGARNSLKFGVGLGGEVFVNFRKEP